MPAFIAGQIGACFLSWHTVTLGALAFLLYFIIKPVKQHRAFIPSLAKMLLCGFASGSAAMLLCEVPARTPLTLYPEQAYLMQVDDYPRHKNVGLKEISVKVKARLKKEPYPRWEPLTPPLRVLAKTISLPWRNGELLTKETLFVARGRFTPLKGGLNPFAFESNLRRQGYGYTAKLRYLSRPLRDRRSAVENAREWIGQKVFALLGNHERAGLVLSMSLGKRDLLSAETEKAFKRTGLAHLLVLSGYQVTLFYYTIFRVLMWLGTRCKRPALILPLSTLCAGAAAVAALLLVTLAGIEGAGMRAVLALIFAAAASTLERAGGLANAIIVSLLVLTLFWPGAYADPGVELTYAALYGIFLGVMPGAGRLSNYLKICFCASLCTTLVVVLWFRNLPLAAFPLNLLLAPLLNLIGCQGSLLALTLYLTGIDYQGCCLQLVSHMLTLFRNVVWYVASAPICVEKLGMTATACSSALIGALILELSRRKFRLYRRINNV